MKNLLIITVVLVLSLTVVTAQATLIDRGNGLIYDTDLDVTWLQDTNYAKTSGFDSDGLMLKSVAETWVEDLVYEGFDDWRLPSALNQDGSGPSGLPLGSYDITGSEMGYMYYVNLGNTRGDVAGGGLTNVGPFSSLLTYQLGYWFAEAAPPDITGEPRSWVFLMHNGFQYPGLTGSGFGEGAYAWAVRDGDVTSVPEPSTIVLMGLGILGLASLGRKKIKK